MNNFHPLEVMGRGSETQRQVVENLIFNVTLQGLRWCVVTVLSSSYVCLFYR